MSNDIVAAVKAGRPPFMADGDRIAKFGKGYSNLLHLAGTEPDYGGKTHTGGSRRHQQLSVTDPNNTSFMSPGHMDSKGYESASAMQTTVTDEAAGLPIHSKARFALYRPELPNINDIPFNSMQAANIYRKKYSNYQREFVNPRQPQLASTVSQKSKAHTRILSQGNYTGGLKGYLGDDNMRKTRAIRNNNYLHSHNVSRDAKSTRLRHPQTHQISAHDEGYISSQLDHLGATAQDSARMSRNGALHTHTSPGNTHERIPKV